LSRIAPLERPWPPFFAEAMERVMPQGAEPLLLFRTVATSPRAWTKFAAGSLLDKGPLPLREREIVIHRTAARCGCDYEWGIHAALFAERAGMDEAQLRDTAAHSVDPALWSEAEAVLLESVDALILRKRLDDLEYERLALHFTTDQILEVIQLAAFYHGVALICGALDLAPEPGIPNLPSRGE
jgi:alkylhydroperoxidase family enzyme